ncbi:hypothetical protein AK830_g4223 [Neonectria ditissima]|uniref:DUF7924 domain-containing protein n=1 Tax=Neonectria ditissima TaxID=78410 RepID=A0A0P7BGI2_9HYPO|nr:hypothetical protein AK830_g4223 [Neonectria ditissima]
MRLRLTQMDARHGPPRRSARLHAQQPSADRTVSVKPCPKPHVTVGARSVSKRTALPQTKTQQSGVDEEEISRVAKTGRQPKPLNRPYASLPEPTGECQEQVSPATLLQTRPIDVDSNNDIEYRPKRIPLTRKALALFNRMEKNKGENGLASPLPDFTVPSSTTKTISTTMSGFAMQARQNGILNLMLSKPPANLGDIQKRHAQSRGSPSPTASVYDRYVKKVGPAPNEATLVFEAGPRLLKEYADNGYHRVLNQACTGFPKDAGFNNGLSAPQPDFVEGLQQEEVGSFPIHDYINGAALYKDDPDSIILPHLAGEWKGPGKNMALARLQSAYDGAALVYARNQALEFIKKSDPPRHAKTTTFTSDGTTLNLFAHYATPSEHSKPKYHQHLITSTNLMDSYPGFKQGYRYLRNAQDCAKEESYELTDQLKKHWNTGGSQSAPPPSTANEDGYQVTDQKSARQPTPEHCRTPSLRTSHQATSSPPAAVDMANGSGRKRKAPPLPLPPPRRSKRLATQPRDRNKK